MEIKRWIGFFFVFISFLFSDPIPNIPQVEKESKQPQIKGIVSPQIELKDGRKIIVKKFNIVGNLKVSTSEIEKVTKEYEGKEITISELKFIADKITEIYWNKGYVTSFAYIPAQKVIDGVVEIKIIEGKIGEIKVEGNRYYTDEFVKKHFDNVKAGTILNNRSLERSLLLLNDYPKLNAHVNLLKGEKEGTTDILVNVEEKNYPFNLNLLVNNFGSRYTGKIRTGFTFDFGNLTKNGDILSLTAIGNIENLNLMKYYKIGYTIPLGGTGAKVGLSWSNMNYQIDEELLPPPGIEVEGKSDIYSLTFSYPLIRSRFQNLTIFGSLNHKDMYNYLFERTYINSHDKYSTLEIGLNRDKLFKNSHLYWTGKLTFGLGTFLGGMSDDEYSGSSRPGLADGKWVKLNFDLVDLFKIGRTQLIAKLSAQYSSDSLVTGEQMVLGGADSVRAYPTGEFLGDFGYLTSLELRMPFIPGESSINKYANWAIFVDHGGVFKNEILPGEEKHNLATGVGAGIRISASYFHLRFDAAKRLGGQEPSDGGEWHYWIQALFNF